MHHLGTTMGAVGTSGARARERLPLPLPRAPLRLSRRTQLGAPRPRGFAASHIQIQSQFMWHPDKPNETGRGRQAGQPWLGGRQLSLVNTWTPFGHCFQRTERRAFNNQGGELAPGAPKWPQGRHRKVAVQYSEHLRTAHRREGPPQSRGLPGGGTYWSSFRKTPHTTLTATQNSARSSMRT